jgi:membrane protein implicated in regulation of membrane protease activity
MKYLLIFAMAVVAVLLIAVIGFLLWLAVDAICAKCLRIWDR